MLIPSGESLSRPGYRHRPAPAAPPTMAHVAISRFLSRFLYRKVRVQEQRPRSITEALGSAPSPFAVEGLLHDFRLFGGGASPKTRAQVLETARVRLCELRGVLP